MANGSTPSGTLRVVGGADLTAQLDREAAEKATANTAPTPDLSGLVGFIHNQYDLMRRHRDNSMSGWSERLLKALRAFNGQYDAMTLNAIQQFGGSEVYSRVTAQKVRGAASLLRDVYLGADKAWGLDPAPDPAIPPTVTQAIETLIHSELAGALQGGQPPDPAAVRDRAAQLKEAARQAAKVKAAAQAQIATDKIEQILDDGGFYTALGQVLQDIPLFPYAVMKGPTVRIKNVVKWTNGQASAQTEPKLCWERVSPFDIYWTPGVNDITDANVIERQRLTRKDLNDCLDLPGYNVDAVRGVLTDYGTGGLYDNWDQTDSERAVQENREDPRLNRSGLIHCLEFQGYAQGVFLLSSGMDPSLIDDPVRDYFVQAWMIGRYVIKVQLAPSPRKRHQYFVTSFEKVPGTIVGNSLTDLLEDVQSVCNAVLRAMVNNLSIASGPQVTVNVDRLQDGEDANSLYPWKRWYVRNHPIGNNTEPPISFWQPTANSQEMMGVYSAWLELADEASAIPRYMTGAQAGTVGRTASGLSMLMSNSSKILQTVAANIDLDIIEQALSSVVDMILLTDTSGLLSGEESVRVMGVQVAVQKETQRARQLEFLQVTANPIDVQIMGPAGRATILKAVSETIGIPGDKIVPDPDQLAAQQRKAQQVAAQQNQPGHGGMGQAAAQAQGNQQPSPVNGDVGPRTNLVSPQPQPAIAGGPQ
jgi:hypothetical protein